MLKVVIIFYSGYFDVTSYSCKRTILQRSENNLFFLCFANDRGVKGYKLNFSQRNLKLKQMAKKNVLKGPFIIRTPNYIFLNANLTVVPLMFKITWKLV